MATSEPRIFKRGPDFNVVLALPTYVASGFFTDYTGTAQIRRYQDDSEEGFIANIDFSWVDPVDARSFTLTNNDTADWPLGLAELDVVLTGPAPDNRKVGTAAVLLKIERSITRGA